VKLGIRSKLFILALGLVVVSFVAADIYLSTTLDRLLTENIRDDLMVRLDLARHDAEALSAPLDDNTAWDDLADELGRLARARVTIIRRDGVVLGDSQVSLNQLTGLENHIDRPEVAEAFARGQGASTRYSTTIRGRMLYAAIVFHRGGETAGVVRIAMPLVEIDQSLAKLRRLLIGASLLALVLAIFLSAVATQLASRNVRAMTTAAKAMAKGDLATRTGVVGHDEFAELGHTLDGLAQSLSASLADLRSERDLLGGMLTGLQEGVLLVGSDGRLALFNPAFREMFLLNADVVGRPLLEVIRHAELKALLDQALRSTIAVSGEIDVAGLKPRRLLVHASAVAGDRGTLLVLVDVTDIRRLETLRRDFVANASHELRTPVASVRSALETLQGALTADPTAAADFLDIIDRNVRRLHQLIEDLLDLSRIESREFKLQREPFNLGSTITNTISVFREKADKKRIKIDHFMPADLPPVRADRRAVEQVLTNLIDNAVKYCPEGAEVRVRASADGSRVRVFVEDTGPGIESQHLPRLFERFYRVDPGRSRELGGTGLGLSIVKHLVEAMGGTVDVESTFGRGTTFSFTLPRYLS
jgi:two-component system phosphate regulon sensor histidine kinase PhoR